MKTKPSIALVLTLIATVPALAEHSFYADFEVKSKSGNQGVELLGAGTKTGSWKIRKESDIQIRANASGNNLVFFEKGEYQISSLLEPPATLDSGAVVISFDFRCLRNGKDKGTILRLKNESGNNIASFRFHSMREQANSSLEWFEPGEKKWQRLSPILENLGSTPATGETQKLVIKISSEKISAELDGTEVAVDYPFANPSMELTALDWIAESAESGIWLDNILVNTVSE